MPLCRPGPEGDVKNHGHSASISPEGPREGKCMQKQCCINYYCINSTIYSPKLTNVWHFILSSFHSDHVGAVVL